jgi:four helix bundle protein
MSNFNDYKTLDVWSKNSELVNAVYMVTKDFSKEELFGLVAQMRKSSISVPSDMAEGTGRNSTNEVIHFFAVSRGPLFELGTQIYLSGELEFIKDEQIKISGTLLEENKKLLNGFISYYKGKHAQLMKFKKLSPKSQTLSTKHYKL